MQKISIASDHNGVKLKDKIALYLKSQKYQVIDLGPYDDNESVDYPDYATKVCESILDEEASVGVLICGTGTGTDNDKTMIDVLTNRCNPTSASDVPGPITELCYNDGQQTYYPKTKLTYGTSGNKWPVNSKIVKSANGIVAINTFP